jgi:hypothetical protein
MHLHTKRLLLREFSWVVLVALHAIECDPAVVMYVCFGHAT